MKKFSWRISYCVCVVQLLRLNFIEAYKIRLTRQMQPRCRNTQEYIQGNLIVDYYTQESGFGHTYNSKLVKYDTATTPD